MDPETLEPVIGTGYPPEFDEACAARAKRRIGDALGLKNFGVDLVTPPARNGLLEEMEGVELSRTLRPAHRRALLRDRVAGHRHRHP